MGFQWGSFEIEGDIGDEFGRRMPEEEMRNLIYHLWCGLTNSNDLWRDQLYSLKDDNYDVVAECKSGVSLLQFREDALKLANKLDVRLEVEDDYIVFKNTYKKQLSDIRDEFMNSTTNNELELLKNDSVVKILTM